MLISALVFGGVFLVFMLAYWLSVQRPEMQEHSAIRKRLKSEDPVMARVRLLKDVEALSRIALLDKLLKQLDGISGPLKGAIDQSGLTITVGAFVLICAFLFFAVALAVDIYFPYWWVAGLCGLVAAYLPFWGLKTARTMRTRKFEEQFPEAIDLISRAMRAGHAFATGLKMAADELPAPAGTEFRVLYERQNYGAQLPDALKAFADRVPSIDARFFVTAVLTQREAGGNLAEVLDRLAAVMRERFRIKREVRVRSAHGRITAWVLAGMPPVLAAFMLSSNPQQLMILTTDPTGIRMIIAAVVLQILGVLTVKKLVKIEY